MSVSAPIVLGTLLQVTPVEDNSQYTVPCNLQIFATILPPGVDIVINIPPFSIVMSATEAAALAAALLEFVAGL